MRVAATPPPADRTIGEAARATGVSVKMIRYYEAIGLLRRPDRSAGNYRLYDDDAVRALGLVGRARALGFPLDEIGRLLSLWHSADRSSADVKALALAHAADLGRRIDALRAMQAAVEALADQCRGDDRPSCPILDDLAAAAPAPTTRSRPHA